MCKDLHLWFILIVISIAGINGESFMECQDLTGTGFVASSQSCQSYIYCNGVDSSLGNCDDGEYFDAEEGTCDYAENVICALDEQPPVVDEPDDEEEEEEEEEQPPEEEPEEPEEEDPEEEVPPVIDVPGEVDIIDIPPVVKPNCPFTDDPGQVIMMASNDSCSDYFLCYHGHAMEMHCTNQLHFNANTGQCDYPENARCAFERPQAHKCLPHMIDFFPHPEKCSYFYYCIKGFLTLQQCPFYYGWDVERRSCVQISVAKCYENSKRL